MNSTDTKNSQRITALIVLGATPETARKIVEGLDEKKQHPGLLISPDGNVLLTAFDEEDEVVNPPVSSALEETPSAVQDDPRLLSAPTVLETETEIVRQDTHTILIFKANIVQLLLARGFHIPKTAQLAVHFNGKEIVDGSLEMTDFDNITVRWVNEFPNENPDDIDDTDAPFEKEEA